MHDVYRVCNTILLLSMRKKNHKTAMFLFTKLHLKKQKLIWLLALQKTELTEPNQTEKKSKHSTQLYVFTWINGQIP